jgi:hypothetical protein
LGNEPAVYACASVRRKVCQNIGILLRQQLK